MVMDYNKMPEPAVRLTDEKLINQIYDAMIDFFTFCILEHESRQVFYEKDNIYFLNMLSKIVTGILLPACL